MGLYNFKEQFEAPILAGTRSIAVTLLFFLCTVPAIAQDAWPPTRTCQQIFSDHYTVATLHRMTNRELHDYTGSFMECEIADPLPVTENTLAGLRRELRRLERQASLNLCISEEFNRSLQFLMEKNLQWEFLDADGR